MADIFISYASEDRPQAKVLAGALAAEGWTVWWDRTIPAGRRYHQVIEDALRDARCVIVMWTEVSVRSDWVRAEAGEGMVRNVLVPVSLDEVQPPLVFRQIQTADLRGWKGDPAASPFRNLVTDITGLLGEPGAAEGREPARRAPATAGDRRSAEATAPRPPKPETAEPEAPGPVPRRSVAPPPADEPAEETGVRPGEPRPAAGRRRLWLGLALAAVAAAVAVGVWLLRPRAPGPPPEILHFEVEPPQIAPGERAALHWKTINAKELDLLEVLPGDRPASLGGAPESGERWVSPARTAVYTLVVRGAGGRKAQREVELVVEAVPSPPPDRPQIHLFEAAPARVERGQRAELRWETAGAEEVRIRGIGAVGPAGAVRVAPEATTTYILEADGPGGVDRREAVVEVIEVGAPGPPPPEIVEFTADRTTVPRGERCRLSWRTSGAERADLNGRRVETSGSQVVAPEETTDFILTAVNPEGVKTSRRLRIVVEEGRGGAERPLNGRIAIPEDVGADLDTGVVGRDEDAWDVWFGAKTPQSRFLYPRNGALIAMVRPGTLRAAGNMPEACDRARLDRRAIAIEDLVEDAEVCVRTSRRQVSWFRVTAPAGRSPGVLQVFFVTWNER